MLPYLKKGLFSGFAIGIIFVFLMLIGFLSVGAGMVCNLFGSLNNSPGSSLIVLIGLFGLLAGITAQNKNAGGDWVQTVLGGLAAGFAGGVLVGAAIWGIGSLYERGVDVRTYLPNLCPTETAFLLINHSALTAAQIYLVSWIGTSLAGAVITKAVSIGDWASKIGSKIKDRAKALAIKKQINNLLENKIFLIGLMVVLGAVLYILPLAWGSYWNYIMGTVAIYVLLGLGLNIIVGYSGQLVLGYVAFFAIGAYTYALLTAPAPHSIELNVWLAMAIAAVISTLTGLLLGLPILNLRGDYLAIVTLGFGEITRILIRSDILTPLTNGPKGITNIGQPTWRGHIFSDVNYMHLLFLLVLAGLFIAKRLKDSRTGRAWISIREDQTVAQATGVNTFRYKILALLLGAAFAGLSGALFASRNQFTGPEDFMLMVSVNVLCIVIVGGMGSLPGVVIGAFVLKGLPELLRELEDYRLLAFGALLVVMMIVRPSGLLPARKAQFSCAHREKIKQERAEVDQ